MVNRTVKVIIFASIACAITAMYFYMSKEMDVKTVRIGDSYLQVEVADSALAQTRGLSGRENLDQNSGMLFVFKDKKIRNFWMKDMQFPLDVVWIADHKVDGIEENISFNLPDAQIARFQSKAAVGMVLEVNAGWVSENGVKIGDLVSIDTE